MGVDVLARPDNGFLRPTDDIDVAFNGDLGDVARIVVAAGECPRVVFRPVIGDEDVAPLHQPTPPGALWSSRIVQHEQLEIAVRRAGGAKAGPVVVERVAGAHVRAAQVVLRHAPAEQDENSEVEQPLLYFRRQRPTADGNPLECASLAQPLEQGCVALIAGTDRIEHGRQVALHHRACRDPVAYRHVPMEAERRHHDASADAEERKREGNRVDVVERVDQQKAVGGCERKALLQRQRSDQQPRGGEHRPLGAARGTGGGQDQHRVVEHRRLL